MSLSRLYASVTGCSNILSVTFSDSHISATSNVVVNCVSSTLQLDDSIDVYVGYVGDNAKIFSGYVKSIDRKTPDGTYVITADNVLIRAVEYFIASSDPESPFTRNSILAEDLVEDILALAGLTNYTATATSFTFGVNSPVEVNLISAYDFCKLVTDILSWHLYADNTGKVHFVNRKPYVMDGTSGQPGDVADTSVKTVTGKLKINNVISEKDLRNRIVVYGRNPINATASQATSYNPLTDAFEQVLPTGFYKTTVVASEWIDTSTVAQDSADYNLQLLNRLTVQATVNIVGDHSLSARQVVTVNDTVTGMSGDWYIYNIEHSWGSTGFTTQLGLRK